MSPVNSVSIALSYESESTPSRLYPILPTAPEEDLSSTMSDQVDQDNTQHDQNDKSEERCASRLSIGSADSGVVDDESRASADKVTDNAEKASTSEDKAIASGTNASATAVKTSTDSSNVSLTISAAKNKGVPEREKSVAITIFDPDNSRNPDSNAAAPIPGPSTLLPLVALSRPAASLSVGAVASQQSTSPDASSTDSDEEMTARSQTSSDEFDTAESGDPATPSAPAKRQRLARTRSRGSRSQESSSSTSRSPSRSPSRAGTSRSRSRSGSRTRGGRGQRGAERGHGRERGRGQRRVAAVRGRAKKRVRKQKWELSEEELSSVDDEASFPSRISPRRKPFVGYRP